MEIKNKVLQIETKKEFEIIDITEKVADLLKESGLQQGFTNIFSKHTTLSIKINENEPLLLADITEFMKKMVDEEGNYHHDIISLRTDCPSNEPKNAKGHLRTLILESSQTIPIIDNKLELGKYQRIFAIETSGPRQRQILIQLIGER